MCGKWFRRAQKGNPVNKAQVQDRACWCGNRRLQHYSGNYTSCPECGTLVSRVGLTPEQVRVQDDAQDYYGKEYWLSHQSEGLGLPAIHERARQDLPGRCLYWLQTLLAYKGPPGKVLELGCAHGGFVALLRWAGFDATGLEVSPWVTDFAQSAFGVPILLGPVEEHRLDEGSYDAIVLNDVLEHLPDPAATMRQCLRLLKPDGALVVQTPEYPDGRNYADVVADRLPFLDMIGEAVAAEHLYVFSRRSVRRLLGSLGCSAVDFLPPFFPCDMYLVASPQELRRPAEEEVAARLAGQPAGRLVQALLDKRREAESLRTSWQNAEADREARRQMMVKLEEHLQALSADHAAQGEVIRKQRARLLEQQRALERIERSVPYRLARLARRAWERGLGRKGAA
jgi:2-polyprenyl-3-methyl-5-hydroxy-6-metoxy-1,4-benzoquinol methylase